MLELTSDNVLERPYMVQDRIAGPSLIFSYPELNHDARRRFAQEFVQVVRILM